MWDRKAKMLKIVDFLNRIDSNGLRWHKYDLIEFNSESQVHLTLTLIRHLFSFRQLAKNTMKDYEQHFKI